MFSSPQFNDSTLIAASGGANEGQQNAEKPLSILKSGRDKELLPYRGGRGQSSPYPYGLGTQSTGRGRGYIGDRGGGRGGGGKGRGAGRTSYPTQQQANQNHGEEEWPQPTLTDETKSAIKVLCSQYKQRAIVTPNDVDGIVRGCNKQMAYLWVAAFAVKKYLKEYKDGGGMTSIGRRLCHLSVRKLVQ